MGYSQKSDGEFQLELRVQSRKGKAYRKAEEFKEKAQHEANWESNKIPFSQPGDSGSLVFTKKGLVAVGLHFAGGVKLVNGQEVGISYSCNIATVLETHKVSLLD